MFLPHIFHCGMLVFKKGNLYLNAFHILVKRNAINSPLLYLQSSPHSPIPIMRKRRNVSTPVGCGFVHAPNRGISANIGLCLIQYGFR